MQNIKITIIETTLNQKIASEYGVPGLSTCPFHKAGQEFISIAGNKPDGLCDEAWTAFGKYAFALAHGADGSISHNEHWNAFIIVDNTIGNTAQDGG